MRIVIAPNSFKNCLNAMETAKALERGVRAVQPEAETELIPLSDGGDGLIAVLSQTLNGCLIESETQDALGRPIKASWLKTPDYAVIEMALASGMAKLRGPSEYTPLKTSTFGTGMLINAALEQGCRNIIIGLGGSATVDAGCGMAQALGFRLEDEDGNPIPRGGAGLLELARIKTPDRNATLLKKAVFTILVDVDNPLLGASGAARVFAPQKGATPEQVEQLERGIARWAFVAERDLGASVATLSGAGAAGGMGAGCVAFLKAGIEPGAAWVAMQSRLPEAIKRADMVFTGEGRIDSQTAFGKAPAYVGKIALAENKPVIVFGGSVEKGIDLSNVGLTKCVEITPEGTELEQAIRDGATNLEKAAASAMSLFLTNTEKKICP